MFNLDPKTQIRLAPLIKRVLVVEPNAAFARLTIDLMKEIGTREIVVATGAEKAMFIANDFDPQLILTELTGPAFDGLAFTHRLRRSGALARKAPVIMMTAEATVESIVAARNAGVHEFLRKPFTAGDLYRRVENVALKSRPWIEAVMYVGPDRRRFNSGEFTGDEKRRGKAEGEAKAG